MADTTQSYLTIIPEAYEDLAHVLVAVGERDDAIAAASHALDLNERKGKVVVAARVRSFLEGLEGVLG